MHLPRTLETRVFKGKNNISRFSMMATTCATGWVQANMQIEDFHLKYSLGFEFCIQHIEHRTENILAL
jgi:hypothetical protein